jgi:hypothetical protein
LKKGGKRAVGGDGAADDVAAPLVKGDDRWMPSAQEKKKHAKTLEQNFLGCVHSACTSSRGERAHRSNLNKLTLENFPLLSRQLTELAREATTPAQLRALVALVIDKAVTEEKFAAM